MKVARSWWIVVAVALGSRAWAESPEAAALYVEGKKLLGDGDIAAACEKFEASEALDRELGTELYLAECREKNGQTASAWVMFLQAVDTAKKHHDPREEDARKRAKALEKRLVHLTIDVAPESEVDGLVIKRNDKPVPRGEWNTTVPVDPDEYEISAEAPGRKRWSDTVIVKTKDKTIEVPKLERARKKVVKEERVPREAPPNRNRGLAIALAGFGLGAGAIATGFAVYSQSVENQADTICPMVKCADAHAVDLNGTARLDGWIANVGWVIGGASLVGAGVAWWLGASDGDSGVAVAPLVGGDRAGFVVGGRF